MRISTTLIIAGTFIGAGALSYAGARGAVQLIEDTSEIGVREALDEAQMPWAEVQADGLRVTLSGIAPTESDRFRALTTAGSVVDSARVIDQMNVKALAEIEAPTFSMEILRNDSGVSVFGLVPAAMDREALTRRFAQMAGDGEATDLLETADYDTPDKWDASVAFALDALRELPRAKISVAPGVVRISAIADSREQKAALERSLARKAPNGVRPTLDISAPRPVISPFALRFVRDDEGARFDACSADTEITREQITQAARAAGAQGELECTLGMGVPSPNWGRAAELAIGAVGDLDGGSVTFKDADITLIAPVGTAEDRFDTVVGDLEAALPDVFALSADLPRPVDSSAGPPEFTATRDKKGEVQLRGRLSNDTQRTTIDSYAKARFGSDKVYTGTRKVDDLPADWQTRALSGLEALSKLSEGSITVTPSEVSVQGVTGNPEARAQIAALLSEQLGEGQDFTLDITYSERLDPVLGLPTDEECVDRITQLLRTQKINFEPGAAQIDAASGAVLDEIAALLEDCADVPVEIQGHTDSQGREEMNQSLSQQRAQSVINELMARRVLTSSFTAVGYGESNPIADNGTAAGREANRRIEFRLITPDEDSESEEQALDDSAQEADDAGTSTQ